MKIYDKVQWHIDGGESPKEAIKKMKIVFSFLNKYNLLTNEGKELYEFGIDSSASLTENMVTSKGKKFLNQYYDEAINYNSNQLNGKLEELYSRFRKRIVF